MDLALGIVVVLLLGLGYAAWTWLIRKLHHCEDRVEQLMAERTALQEALVRHGRQREETKRELAKWPEDYLGENHHGDEAPA